MTVVDGTVVDNAVAVLRIENENLCRPRHAERLADELFAVHQDGNFEAIFLGLLRDLRPVILQLRVQHEELDALIGKALLQIVQILAGIAHDRAAIALCHDHDGLGIAVVIEFVRLAFVVREAEIVGVVRDLRGRHFCRRLAVRHCRVVVHFLVGRLCRHNHKSSSAHATNEHCLREHLHDALSSLCDPCRVPLNSSVPHFVERYKQLQPTRDLRSRRGHLSQEDGRPPP